MESLPAKTEMEEQNSRITKKEFRIIRFKCFSKRLISMEKVAIYNFHILNKYSTKMTVNNIFHLFV